MMAALGAEQTLNPAPLCEIRRYIKRLWRTTLRRSNATLLESATDPKVGQASRLIIYVAQDEDSKKIAAGLRQLMPAKFDECVEVRQLPAAPETIVEAGLLYLPHPYVVPGGRFNEQYGWDSYFTLLGLARDGELQQPRT